MASLEGRARPEEPLGPEARALLAALPGPTLLVGPGPDRPIRAANPAFLALAGFEGEGQEGRTLRDLFGAQADRAAWHHLLEAPGPVAEEILCTRADGVSFWGSFARAPLGADGGLDVVQVVDVTRRRDAEGALRLAERREALGLLTNSVAHEFNNFLQILIGYVDGLKRRLGDRPEPFIQRAIVRSTEAVERATVLTRHLLAHSRRIAPDVRPVDLAEVAGDVAGRLRATLPGTVTLTVRNVSGLPPALANPTQVALALDHIVANSTEAMPGGGAIEIVPFALEPGDRTLARPAEGAVGLAVSDTGPGISPEMLGRALAPFATSREAGRGAGLAIVHGLMKRQNGTVSLESRPGEGTTVRLVFPAA